MAERPQSERRRRARVLVWDSLPPDADRSDRPVSKLFEPPKDRKGWDRVSITFHTHPLHRRPNVAPGDLTLPRRTSRLRLVGDCFLFTVTLILVCGLPLWVVAVLANSDLHWVWAGVAVVATAAGVLLFVRGIEDSRRPPDDLL
jgi:hypothetical protein